MIFLQDFEVDETSPEYLALHPLAPTAQPSLVEEHFEPVIEDEDHSLSDSDALVASDDEDKHDRSKDGKKSRVPRYTLYFFVLHLAYYYFFFQDCLSMHGCM